MFRHLIKLSLLLWVLLWAGMPLQAQPLPEPSISYTPSTKSIVCFRQGCLI